jgi:hypothetical protein
VRLVKETPAARLHELVVAHIRPQGWHVVATDPDDATRFIEALGFPAISVPNVNFDNNQHAENENLRLGHFFRAITTMAALLTM